MGTSRAALPPVLVLSLVACLASGPSRAEEDPGPPERRWEWLVLPVPFYTPETEAAGSLIAVFWEGGEVSDSKSSVSALYTFTENDQTLFQLSPDIYLWGGDVNVTGLVAYQDWPSFYYGIGPEAEEDAREDFDLTGSQARLAVNWRLLGALRLGVGFEYEDMRVTPATGGLLESSGVLGTRGGVASGLGVRLVLDTRDDVILPTKGWHVQLCETVFDEHFGSEFEFSVTSLDAKRYFPVRTVDVLAFELVGRSADGEVPFQQLSLLGGQSIMRGYYWGRFRDNAYAALQGEYRVRLAERIGLAAFVGFGGVAESADELDLDTFQVAGGVGLRFRLGGDASATARGDLAFTEEGAALYLTLGEAF